MNQMPQRSWLGRNWKWLVPVGCLGVFVLSVALCAGIVGVVFASMRSSWAYAEGVKLAQDHPAVKAELGEPVESGWLVSGSINVSGPSGSANLAIPISGPKNAGVLYVVAQKNVGQWRFTQAVVAVEPTGARIDLLQKTD